MNIFILSAALNVGEYYNYTEREHELVNVQHYCSQQFPDLVGVLKEQIQ